MVDILFSAFLLSTVLLGICTFFGLEIIRRGIIFTDLAIGQMAALGAAVSLFFLDGGYLYPISLGSSLAGGLIIASVSRRSNNVEAFIGLLYAFGFAGVYILLSKSYHGMETFQKLMAADILFTPLSDVLRAAFLFAVLGILLLVLYQRISGFLRELLFFVTFAVMVTTAVKLAGVLVLFSLLVGPALIATHIPKGRPLLTAWLVGTAINILAIFGSDRLDLPTGYSIVFLNALVAVAVCALPRRRMRASETSAQTSVAFTGIAKKTAS